MKKVALWLFALTVATGTVYGLGWSNILAIKSIEFTGVSEVNLVRFHLQANQSKLVTGQPLARINPRTEANKITELKWIAEARISRDWWQRKVVVDLVPRTPVAMFKDRKTGTSPNLEPRYLASDGVEFSGPGKFPKLAEITVAQKSIAARREVAQFVSYLPDDLVSALVALEVTEDGEMLTDTNLGRPFLSINWGRSNLVDDVAVKSQVLKGLLALPENKKIRVVDLRSVNSPIVK